MDPYLELRWGDVHGSLITYARDAVQAQLGSDLVARMEERVYVEKEKAVTRSVRPDIHIIEEPLSGSTGIAASTLTVAEPIVFRLQADPVVERHIQIVDPNGDEVITAIEFLSPANKMPGTGFKSFRKKRKEFLRSGTNLVEIDLVRAGDWQRTFLPLVVPAKMHATYRAVIRRATDPGAAEYYAFPLRKALPRLAIPLRPTDKDIVLDLQALIDKVYENGRYDRTDYSKPPNPPLTPDELEWMQTLLTGRNA